MEDKHCQLDFCPTRKGYYQSVVNNRNKPTVVCCFCDLEMLKANYILAEDTQCGVRTMMNKSPYPDFDQAIHLLIMPIAHKELPSDFGHKDFVGHSEALWTLSAKLYADAYSQEYFTSWGKMAGQTVPHWHSHFKNYIMPPLSMPERMKSYEKFSIKNVEDAFKITKKLLETTEFDLKETSEVVYDFTCPCCLANNVHKDEENFVIARFKHNYICLAHYPRYPGEVIIIPNRHVAAIKDLSSDELQENMALAMALFPRMKEYAHAHIRDCDGGNIYTKSMGGKASLEQQTNHHVYTMVIPRTTITLIPSAMDGNSLKLDFDPNHLCAYLKEKINEIKEILIEEGY